MLFFSVNHRLLVVLAVAIAACRPGGFAELEKTSGPRAAARADPAGSLGDVRRNHTATLLPKGQVLVAGGEVAGTALASCRLFDPDAGMWSAIAPMASARREHAATFLPTGKVLVTGGVDASGELLATTEIYDPETGEWEAGGPMARPHFAHTATLLRSGQVLVVGGTPTTAELYDPVTDTWRDTGSPRIRRWLHTATLLASGEVLVVGGSDTFAARAERYNPGTGTWRDGGLLGSRRVHQSATLLPCGAVAVVGGVDPTLGTALSSVELYWPASDGVDTVTPLDAARYEHTATLLPSGKLRVDGGTSGAPDAETYDPTSNTWSPDYTLYEGRSRHTATMLPSGCILLAGGGKAAATLYVPYQTRSSTAATLAVARKDHSMTPLPSGKVLIAGGWDGQSALASAEIFDPATGSFTPTGALNTPRWGHSAVLLTTGEVLVSGGFAGLAEWLPWERYDPETGTWALEGYGERGRLTTLLLSSGRVLFISAETRTTVSEYDPVSMRWVGTSEMATYHGSPGVVVLGTGEVLVAGGTTVGDSTTASVEIYDPATRTFRATGSLLTPRVRPALTLLATGEVLATGGTSGSTQLATTERWDPSTGTWTAARSMPASRSEHVGLRLPSGHVLVTGGGLGYSDEYDPDLDVWQRWSGSPRNAAALLPDGRVLVTGGDGYSSVTNEARVFDVRPGALMSAMPSVDLPPSAAPGETIDVSGARLTGVSEGTDGHRSSSTGFPLVRFTRHDGGRSAFAGIRAFGPESLRFTVPAVPYGWYWVQPVVNGVPGDVHGLLVREAFQIAPATRSTPPRGSIWFSATGGIRTGYTWSIAENRSGATMDAASGRYRAGSTPDVTDVVQVTDGAGGVGRVEVTVTAGLTIVPAAPVVRRLGTVAFAASGGAPAWRFWLILSSESGGSIDGDSGDYRAGARAGVDIIRCSDGLGNVATVTVTVTPPIVIAPHLVRAAVGESIAFSASGGWGTGVSWSLLENRSGGSIDAAAGAYAAGSSPGTDVVRVEDAAGNSDTATVEVGGSAASSSGGGGCGYGGGGSGSVWGLVLVAAVLRGRALSRNAERSSGASGRPSAPAASQESDEPDVARRHTFPVAGQQVRADLPEW